MASLLLMHRLALAFLLVSTADCNSVRTASPEFGDSYVVLVEDGGPALVDGRLLLTARYGGGCEDHTFTLRTALDGDTAEIWLVHDANGDACEALITDPLDLSVPSTAASAGRVMLLAPDGADFILR